MSVRLFHKDARLVLVIRRQDGDRESEYRWIALHLVSHPWSRIFTAACRMLDLVETPSSPDVNDATNWRSIARGMDLRWTPARYWTTIHLRLTQGSVRKRQLIAAALLKAARYQLLSRP